MPWILSYALEKEKERRKTQEDYRRLRMFGRHRTTTDPMLSRTRSRKIKNRYSIRSREEEDRKIKDTHGKIGDSISTRSCTLSCCKKLQVSKDKACRILFQLVVVLSESFKGGSKLHARKNQVVLLAKGYLAK
jgi:hypothetical protein